MCCSLCALTIPFLRPVSECTGMRTVVTVPNSEKKSRTAFSSASKDSPPTKMVFEAPPLAVTTAPESVFAFFSVSSTVVPLLFFTGTSSSESLLEEEEEESRLRLEAAAFAAGAAAAGADLAAGFISVSESDESELEDDAAFLAGVAFRAGDLALAAAAGAAFFFLLSASESDEESEEDEAAFCQQHTTTEEQP